MPTQTGSIDLSASNSVKLQADAQYSALSDNLSENYYTKSEFSVAPGEIVSTIEERTELSARPNLSPYFSSTFGDTSYWTGSTTPYRSSELGDIGTKLADGWMHVDMDNSARSGTAYLNTFILPQAWVKNSTEYTFLVEVRNLTMTSGTYVQFRPAQGGESSQTGVEAYVNATEDGSYHLRSTTKENATSVSSFANFSRGYVAVIAGTNASFDYRLSVYEGEYDGPYKPYVDQSLLSRVSSAETTITQHTEAISLRATKTEAYQNSQPNLAPLTQADLTDVYNATTNPGGYWRYPPSSWFTQLEDGWIRVYRDNSNGTSDTNTILRPRACPSIVPGNTYTILIEIRNNHTTGTTPADMYIQQTANNQFWGSGGGNIQPLTYGETAVIHSRKVADTAHITSTPVEMLRYNTRCAAGTVLDFELRLSIYEGEYDGPYKPYVGSQLFASQAELKVANDAISARVEKDGVIGAINLSSEEATINANRINLVGAVTIGDLTQDAQDATLNSNVSVGGRNLLWKTGSLPANWITSNNTAAGGQSDPFGGTNAVLITPSKATHYYVYRWAAHGMPKHPANGRGGGEFTFSVWLKAAGSTANVGLSIRSANSGKHMEEFDVANTWTHVEMTGTIANGITNSDVVWLGQTSTDAFYMSYPKLEMGNRATDWTPAPEDVVSATTYVTEIGGGGIKVHPNGNTQDYAAITSNGMEVYSGGESVAAFGSTARIGDADLTHMEMAADELSLHYVDSGGAHTKAFSFKAYRTSDAHDYFNTELAFETAGPNSYAISIDGTRKYSPMTIGTANSDGHVSTLIMYANDATIRLEHQADDSEFIEMTADNIDLNGKVSMLGDADVSTIASIITNVQSGVTVNEARYVRRGQTAMLRMVVTATAAKSGTWQVGTVVDGKRPFMQTFGSATNASFAGRVDAGGALYAIGSLAANAGLTLTFTYVVQD